MRFEIDGAGPLEIDPSLVVVAGFTARDPNLAHHHLRELADEGIQVPARVPSFYPVPTRLLVQEGVVAVTHERTSGEAEVVLLVAGRDIYVTLGSDHTDRLAETKDIALSKLVCPKVVATRAWPLTAVRGSWDDMQLRSWIVENGRLTIYQEGTMASLLLPEALLEQIRFRQAPRSYAVFTGTLPARGGIRPAERFVAELRDTIRDAAITLEYAVAVIDPLRWESAPRERPGAGPFAHGEGPA